MTKVIVAGLTFAAMWLGGIEPSTRKAPPVLPAPLLTNPDEED